LGYAAIWILSLTKGEWDALKSKFSTSKRGGKVKLPAAFPEKGLYMLATILKSRQATDATFTIIETFAKIRELSRTITTLSVTKKEFEQTRCSKEAANSFPSFLMSSSRSATRKPRSNSILRS